MQYNYKNNPWFIPLKTNVTNKLTLFCFHHAGGSASTYKNWSNDILDNVDLIAVQLPGRENRFCEPFKGNMQEVIESLFENFQDFKDKSFIFFGHSLGAIISYELACKIQNENSTNLQHLIVSACKAPQSKSRRNMIYNLTDQQLFEEICKYNGIPKELLNEKELLMDIMLPIIRADFTISDLYKCDTRQKLKCPITSLGGDNDDTLYPESLLEWNIHTDSFNNKNFKGDHFFINSSYKEVINLINSILYKELTNESK
jgi:medium-chain acyl-[acyl-carrier-protein] hydrolase